MSHPPIRSYVLRQGRFSRGQQRAYAELLPRFGLAYRAAPLDWRATFGREAPVVAEVGFGMGETTAEIAAANPAIDYLAIEVHTPGVGSLLKQIEQGAIANIRVVQHDAVEVMRDMVPAGSLAAIHIFFPDPWPKKRHHKRRLVQPDVAALLARKLAPGGVLHAATDWADYAEQMQAVFAGEPLLEPAAIGFTSRPPTKFASRGQRLGHAIRDLYFRRP